MLKEIISCAYLAPSAKNRQLWKFTVIQNKAVIKELAEVIGKEFDDSAYDFYNPDALILASNERDYDLGREDCACALENIFLAAHAYGIGSVWINQFRNNCDKPEFRQALRKINLPDNHIIVGAAALGYPKAVSEAQKNKDVVEWVK
ncbi:hypothetical protein SDC9_204523 [bioreactor metagenome]|uniref:Nitroreductase domain-containing protein n=1 Tax=bioreactor metagenome TaxID=1076179 RepID=A0A645J0Y7_9ZZZZ